MAILRAGLEDLNLCTDILFIPEIGQLYYPKKDLLCAELEKSIPQGEVYVKKGLDLDSDIWGVIWFQREGLFHTFPYLHMIAVKEEYRKLGVGASLMEFYEQECLREGKNRIRTKAFLLVSAFNIPAQHFYQERGYTEQGRFENLFRKGVTEILLMKKVTETRHT